MRVAPLVLVADDEPGMRRLLRAVLELDGYLVVEAADGDAGCARAPMRLAAACAAARY